MCYFPLTRKFSAKHFQNDDCISLKVTDDSQVILGPLTSDKVGLDSRFGAERVQPVPLLSGQGHSLAASGETDPLTVDHCFGGQAVYNKSTIRPGYE